MSERERLKLVHSGSPLPGTITPRWSRKRQPISHVNIRPAHPSLHVYDVDNETVSDLEFLTQVSMVCNFARDSGMPDMHMAARTVAAWVNERFADGSAS